MPHSSGPLVLAPLLVIAITHALAPREARGGALLPDSLVVRHDTLAPERTIGGDLVDDLVIIGRDGLAFFAAPFHFDATGWLVTGGVIGGTLATFPADRGVHEWFRETHFSPAYDRAFWFGTNYGELLYAQVFSGVVYTSGLLLREDWVRVTGRMLAQSILYSGTITMSLRYLFGRSRPANTDDPWEFNGFQSRNEVQSLPSGHTSVAFAVSSILADRIGHPVATVLLYSAAALTGISRLYYHRHWASDVVLGAAVGISSGLFVAGQEAQREGAGELRGSIQIYPTGNGIAMTWWLD